MNCPFCNTKHHSYVSNYVICESCGCEHNEHGEIFKEGDYSRFIRGSLQTIINESSTTGLSHMVKLLQNEASKNPNDLDGVLSRLGEIVEHLESSMVLGKDRKHELVAVIECIERIWEFGKGLHKKELMESETHDFIYGDEVDDLEEGRMSDIDIVSDEVVEMLDNQGLDYDDETIKSVIYEISPEYCDDESVCKFVIDAVKEKKGILENDLDMETMPEPEGGIGDFEDEQAYAQEIDSDIDELSFGGPKVGDIGGPDTDFNSEFEKELDNQIVYEANCGQRNFKVSVKGTNENQQYTIYEGDDIVVSYNEETGVHDGLDLISEEEIEEIERQYEASCKKMNEDHWEQEKVDNAELQIYPNEDGTFRVEDENGEVYPKMFASEEEAADYFFDDYGVEIIDHYEKLDAQLENTDGVDDLSGDEFEIDQPLAEALKVTKHGEYNKVEKPEVIKATKANGEKPDHKISSYRTAKLVDPENPIQGYEEQEDEIPYTEKEANKEEVDKIGIKKGKLKESIEGFRLEDKIRIAGHAKEFVIVGIENDTILAESKNNDNGSVIVRVNPYKDFIELAEDKSVQNQRKSEIIEDTRALWESVEHNYKNKEKTVFSEILTEGCEGGVCSIGGSSSTGGTGIGSIGSVSSSYVSTISPDRALPKVSTRESIYRFVKENDLHVSGREMALESLLKEFANTEEELSSILDDASSDRVEEMDEQYGYQGEVTNYFSLNEAYEEMKKNGLV
jgi:hypothetical protein